MIKSNYIDYGNAGYYEDYIHTNRIKLVNIGSSEFLEIKHPKDPDALEAWAKTYMTSDQIEEMIREVEFKFSVDNTDHIDDELSSYYNHQSVI